MASTAVATPPEKTPSAQPVSSAAKPVNSPSELMRYVTGEMERMFNEFGLKRRWPFGFFNSELDALLWSPDIEVSERDGKLAVRVDLPGLTKKDVTIEASEDALTIEGERKHEAEKKSEGYYRSERSYGHFRRTIALPEGTKVDTARAAFDNGVLTIEIETPIRQTDKTRQIEIV